MEMRNFERNKMIIKKSPVDCAAVDKRRVYSTSMSEGSSGGTGRNRNVKIPCYSLSKEIQHGRP